ncbi:MAG: putative protein conserved in bacteria (DUF2059) [Rhodobacteraceae bacterium HLUCCO07]|nr:MAG: putative protein conserved in bacteria (DUF2059) [Rhodobacteraceae bacterium HLUCCO07]
MMRVLIRSAFAVTLALFFAQEVAADEAEDRAALNRALSLTPLMEIMQQEGEEFGAGLGQNFLPGGGGAAWHRIVTRIYDSEKMARTVERGLEEELPARHLPDLLAFFRSETGERIVEHEIAARRAFLDSSVEDAAKAAYRAAREGGNDAPGQDRRLDLIGSYVAANDLIEFNVAGALNSNLRFYQGMVDGGGLEMSDAEMVDEVWAQEEETRSDTEEWMMSYLMLAYSDLSEADLSAYTTFSETASGQALNRALFAGFDRMYAEISYALGLALAAHMEGEDL